MSSRAHAGVGVRLGRRQQLERQRQQRVSRQDGGPFVERLVHGRFAAAQIVVVHGRQVVVHERIAMHALERRRRCSADSAGTPNRRAHSKVRNGTQPLAAAERAQPHRLDQPLRGAVRGRRVEERGKARFDERCGAALAVG